MHAACPSLQLKMQSPSRPHIIVIWFFLSTTADKSDLIDVEFQLQFLGFFFPQLLLKVLSRLTVDNTRPLPGSFRETRKSCIQLRDFFFWKAGAQTVLCAKCNCFSHWNQEMGLKDFFKVSACGWAWIWLISVTVNSNSDIFNGQRQKKIN